MSVPLVEIGLRQGRVFVIPQLSPGRGTYVDKDPIREASPDDAEGVGRAIFDALADFSEISTMPNLLHFRSPVIAASGVNSYSEYERGLRSCLIDQHDDHFTIRGLGPHAHLPCDVTARQLGETVLNLLCATPQKRKDRQAKR